MVGYLVGECGCFHLLFNVLKFLYLPLFSLPLYTCSNLHACCITHTWKSRLLVSHLLHISLQLLSIYTHGHAKPNHLLFSLCFISPSNALLHHLNLHLTNKEKELLTNIHEATVVWWVIFMLSFVKWTLSC